LLNFSLIKIIPQKKKSLLYVFFIITIIISIFIGENSTGGAKGDALATQKYIDAFIESNLNGFQYIIATPEVHFPFFYFLIGNLIKLFGVIFVKVFYIGISSLIPLFFYKSISKVYQNQIDNNYLFYFSLILFLSPNLRSSAVWVTTDNLATLFFILSIYYFVLINNDKNKQAKLLYVYFCFIYLILASYIRPYYCLFYFYFSYFLLNRINFVNIIYILIFKIILSLPAVVYIFYLLKFRGSANLNETSTFFEVDYVYNYLVFSSLYLFYFFSFVFVNYKEFYILNLKNQKKIIFILIIFFILLAYFYSIPLVNTGGGIFYKLSKIVYIELFYIFSFLGSLLLFLLNKNNLNNILLIIIVIFCFPFYRIVQKYYDPLILIVFLILINSNFVNSFFRNLTKFKLSFIYTYFLFFLLFVNFYYK
jgi:hypothetical protein